MTESTPRAEPIRMTIPSLGLSLNRLDWGGIGPTVLLVHGARDQARSWDFVANRLVATNWVTGVDLRGHGDSEPARGAGYTMAHYVADLAAVVDSLGEQKVALLGHSLGGNICLRYAALFPERVSRVIAIEGLGPSPQMEQTLAEVPDAERWRRWISEAQDAARRSGHAYRNLDEACTRMRAANPHLSEALALHLTQHGLRRHSDGTLRWKFDNAVRPWPPIDMPREAIRDLWSRIACPVLLVYGTASWASNPATDGRAAHFRDARVVAIEGAGHWVHHDRFAEFMDCVEKELA